MTIENTTPSLLTMNRPRCKWKQQPPLLQPIHRPILLPTIMGLSRRFILSHLRRRMLPQRKLPLSLSRQMLNLTKGTDAAACLGTGASTSSLLSNTLTATPSSSNAASATAKAPTTATGTSSSHKSTATPNYAADSWRAKGANIGFAGLLLGAVIML
jgi:hypothetical protein